MDKQITIGDLRASLSEKPCQFCGFHGTIKFNEHYYFCTQCGAITTHCITLERNCKHINDKTWILVGEPIIRVAPWKGGGKLKPTKPIIVEHDGEQYCSVCGKHCIADGW